MRSRAVLAGVLALTLAAALRAPASAGPPFLTDDPQPVDYHHSELYVFGTSDRTPDGHSGQGPAVEYNLGAAPNLQLHLVAPLMNVSPAGGPFAQGYGDTEFGVKYRFVQETAGRPQVGIFPMAEFATGSADRGLGNGQTWYRLPLWIQKSYGKWTTYGGGGVAINHAPGMQDYGFAGWLVQRDLGEHWTLGGEVFTQGAAAIGGEHATFYNVGGYYKPTDHFNVLFSLGHTVSGENHAIGYFGLYWTWGPKEPVAEEGRKPGD